MDKFLDLKNGYKYRFIATNSVNQFFQFVTPTNETLDIPVFIIQSLGNKKDIPTKNLQIKYLRDKYKIGLPLAIRIYEFALERYPS